MSDIVSSLFGQCATCKQYVKMLTVRNAVSAHKNFDDEDCKGFRHRPRRTMYRLETLEEALAMAKVIAEDDDTCLQNGNEHKKICGNGKACAKERRRRAKALAQYFLHIHNPAE